jgi:ABC-type multidrug transport system ATPase subunit
VNIPFIFCFIKSTLLLQSSYSSIVYMDSTDEREFRNATFQSHPNSVDVILQDFSIAVESNDRRKDILHPISTVVEGGTLFAILGGSGSGKTTLLNVIAGRFSSKQLKVGGEIRFGAFKQCTIGYVTQQDFLLPNLTVRETLMFAARMKVSPTTKVADSSVLAASAENSHARREGKGDSGACTNPNDLYAMLVEDVIQDLGLKECTNSMVGDNSSLGLLAGGNRGLSGGERRRVSIGIQIISDPKGTIIAYSD